MLLSRLAEERRRVRPRDRALSAAALLAVPIFALLLVALEAAVSPAHSLVAALLGALAAGIVGVLVGGHRERERTRRQLEAVADTVETLSAHDVVVVADALADIAQGEGARLLRIEAAPVTVPPDRTVRRLAEAVNTTVARLESSVEQFNLGAVEPCRRLFYVGPDDFLLGSICAEELARRVPPDAELLVLLGRFSHSGMELRRRGFESGLRDRAPEARIAAAFENRYDSVRTYDFVKAFLRSHPRLAGIYSAEGVAVQGAAQAVAEAGRAHDVAIVCHDLVEDTIPFIRSGVIAGTVVQDAFGQGFETPIHLFNHVAFGWLPPEQRLSTRMEFVTAENVDRFWTPEGQLLDSAVALEARPAPFGRAAAPVRIAVLGISDNPFWRFVHAGGAIAGDLLHDSGALVEWLNVDESAGLEGRHEQTFERVVEQGYDAIATPVFELGMVPLINRAVDGGIAVATYNSETASLGGLIAALSRQWRRLEETASRLEESATCDALTGVRNRRAMEADLAAMRARLEAWRPSAVIMIDIDKFKDYNDACGHPAGDDVLRAVASAIRRALRPTDRVYRYGGEEFLAALDAGSPDGAESAARRIVAAVHDLGLSHPGNAPWGVVTVSAGVAALRRPDEPEKALEDADAALYSAKAAGRNRAASYERAAA